MTINLISTRDKFSVISYMLYSSTNCLNDNESPIQPKLCPTENLSNNISPSVHIAHLGNPHLLFTIYFFPADFVK